MKIIDILAKLKGREVILVLFYRVSDASDDEDIW